MGHEPKFHAWFEMKEAANRGGLLIVSASVVQRSRQGRCREHVGFYLDNPTAVHSKHDEEPPVYLQEKSGAYRAPRNQEPVSADGSENGLSIGGSKPVLAPRPDRVAAPPSVRLRSSRGPWLPPTPSRSRSQNRTRLSFVGRRRPPQSALTRSTDGASGRLRQRIKFRPWATLEGRRGHLGIFALRRRAPAHPIGRMSEAASTGPARRPRRLIGVLACKLPCGRCQL